MKIHHRYLSSFLMLCCLTSTPDASADERTTKEIMWGLYDAIAYLLPYSVLEKDHVSSLDQALLDKHLSKLVDGADSLTKHAGSQNAEFKLLARSFKTIVSDIEKGFKDEWPTYSYYSLTELTQHCVSCHSRLPGESAPWFGQKLLARIDTNKFATWNLVNLLIATREFNTAMQMLEKALQDPKTPPSELEYSGYFITYLRVAINIDGDITRPHKFLGKFLERKDIPYYLRFRIEKWREYMTALEPAINQPPTLASAKLILQNAVKLTQIPGDAVRAVHDLIAATILQKLLDGRTPLSPQDRAEAYFNLGLIALRTFEIDFSVPELEYLFIAAINADPKGRFAEPAYRYLEEFGYIEDEDAPTDTGPLVQRVVDLAALRENAGIKSQ